MSTYLADGIGGDAGDSLCLEIGFIGLNDVWYVSSESGVDASGYGRSRERPYATIPYAIDHAADYDVITVLADHNEDQTARVEVDKSVLIVGEGSSGGRPTAVWGHDATGSDAVLAVTADDVEIRNIKFTACQQEFDGTRIAWQGDNGRVRSLYIEANEHNNDSVFHVAGAHLHLDSTTWISSSATTAAPDQALSTEASGLVFLRLTGCVFSGGSSGWASTDGAAYIADATCAVRIEAQSLLLGADLKLAPGVSGYVSVPTATGGAQVRGV